MKRTVILTTMLVMTSLAAVSAAENEKCSLKAGSGYSCEGNECGSCQSLSSCGANSNACKECAETTRPSQCSLSGTAQKPQRPAQQAQKPAQRPTETTTEEAAEETTEKATEKPAETTTQRPAQDTAEAATETTTEAASGSSDASSTMEEQVVKLVNEERAKYGLQALTIDSGVSRTAQAKSEDMRDNNYFSHTSPTYGSPFDMLKTFGISYTSAGENIAKGQKTAEDVVNAWMASEGHRANILSSSFTKIGVGYAEGNGTTYWTQMFIR